MSTEHSTATVVLSDGTHRTTQWFRKVEVADIARHFAETMALAATSMDGKDTGVRPLWAFTAIGCEHMQYTSNEVEEIARDPRYQNLARSDINLTRLTVQQIDQALRLSGYTDNKLLSAEFVALQPSKNRSFQCARYRVTCDNAGERSTGDVYVKLREGRYYADF